MRRHLLVALIIMVLGPLVLLSALAVKVLSDEEALVRHGFRELMEQRLEDSRSAIGEVVGTIEVEVVRDLEAVDGETEALRDLERRQPLIRQIFLADAEGRRLHPPQGDEASRDEREFIDRTRAIWEASAELARAGPSEAMNSAYGVNSLGWSSTPTNLKQAQRSSPSPSAPDDLFMIPQAAQQAPQALQAPQAPETGPSGRTGESPAADSLAGLARMQPQGWIAWYWEEGLHLLFWRRRADGLIAGVELERATLLQRLIAALPATGEQESLIVVADARDESLYQWGNLEPPEGSAPLARLPLAPPLEAWTLQYFGDEAETPVTLTTSRLIVLLGVGATAVVLLGLAVFFYREWSRNMRDARQRVTFVTQVSHELKTPLTNIRLYAELLADEIDGVDEQATEHAGVIVSECQRLSRLIANVLTFSRSGRPGQRARPLALGGVIKATIEHFGPAFAERGILVQRTGDAPRPVLADEDAVGQILANLLSNVEKYAAAGKRADVEVEQDRQWTRIRVRDHGPGIPPRHRRRIFDPFFRARDDLSEGVSGTGIGLTIARDLARQQGGDLELLSGDGGACFQLTLPTAADAALIADADASAGAPDEPRSP
ncbi:MAG: HAMP domain-containing sensor histidine kinase [Nannocystaceae bacterium]